MGNEPKSAIIPIWAAESAPSNIRLTVSVPKVHEGQSQVPSTRLMDDMLANVYGIYAGRLFDAACWVLFPVRFNHNKYLKSRDWTEECHHPYLGC